MPIFYEMCHAQEPSFFKLTTRLSKLLVYDEMSKADPALPWEAHILILGGESIAQDEQRLNEGSAH